jgi:O-antigen/teichoic acid export membrane protein
VLINQGSLQAVAWIWLAGTLLGMIALLCVAIWRVGGLHWADWLDWHPLVFNRHAILSFLFITAMMTLEAQVDTLILSAFHNETVVGWYSAATTVVFSLFVFAQAYRFSIYPLMTRYALHSPEKLSKLYERSMRYLGMLVLPMVAGIALLSPQIILLVFGPGFQPTVRTLRMLILSLVFVFLNVPDSRMMLVKDCQRWSLLFLLVSVTVNVLLNLVLDSSWEATGAAVARFCSSLIFFLLTHLYVTRRFVTMNIIQLQFKALLATAIMSLVVWLVQTWPLAVSIGLGVMVYIGALWLVGGILPDDAILICQAFRRWHSRLRSA